ncbi:hypothetical protein AT15_04960 [Kosmotoga arenicorallina S304]|uniref:Uncharacterized protein n=1 Tax=Kosmotoga arenicorallina S304 TaxID=1453497 RepID=A0A176JVD6_9BACT|nr:hypothetical protein [Kosmotoga arenicorallina]OAA27569.1 hypothetical protein AT15_04960 [Kosmotoga arenicorallina S304]
MKGEILVVKPSPSLGWIIVLGSAIICFMPLWLLLLFQPPVRMFLIALPAILSGSGIGIFSTYVF